MSASNFFSGGDSITVNLDRVPQYDTKPAASGVASGNIVYDRTDGNFYTTDGSSWSLASVNVQLTQIASLSNLKALSAGQYARVYLNSGGRSGTFIWDSSNLSTEVSNDTSEGVYVPPNSDATGASGAWVRQYDSFLNIRWFGAEFGSGSDNTTAFQSAIDTLPESGGTIYFPAGGTGNNGAATAHYYFDSGVTISGKSIELRGEGSSIWIPVNLVYTGNSTFIKTGANGLHTNTIGFRGVDDADGTVYRAGSIAIEADASTRIRETKFTKFDVAVERAGGFYHEFQNVEINTCNTGFNRVDANNLTFIGGRFNNFHRGVDVASGVGPISFYGTSFEKFTDRVVNSNFGSEIDINFWGCYIENKPSEESPKGIGSDGENFDSGIVAVPGPSSVALTMQGCLINTSGISRITSDVGSAGNVVTVNSGGNTWVLHNSSPSNTLEHGWYFGDSDVLLTGIDKFEGTPPAGATFITNPATGSMYNTWDDLTNHIINGAEATGTINVSSGELQVSGTQVAQYDSGANGEYERLYNGVQKCWIQGTATYASDDVLQFSWTFPVSFSANPVVTTSWIGFGAGSFTPSTTEIRGTDVSGLGTTSVNINLRRVNGMTAFASGDTAEVMGFAVGTWS